MAASEEAIAKSLSDPSSEPQSPRHAGAEDEDLIQNQDAIFCAAVVHDTRNAMSDQLLPGKATLENAAGKNDGVHVWTRSAVNAVEGPGNDMRAEAVSDQID